MAMVAIFVACSNYLANWCQKILKSMHKSVSFQSRRANEGSRLLLTAQQDMKATLRISLQEGPSQFPR